MIKSPLRYPGGKSKAVPIISKYIPEFSEFREPFVGGGSVFVYLKQKFPNKRFWINDIYQNLFLFWKECQESPLELIRDIEEFRNMFSDGKDLHRYILEKIDDLGNSKRAAAFFAINRMTFSGTSESGGFSQAAFEKRFTSSSIERVRALSAIIDDTKITNLDYVEVLAAEGDNVFIFLDPPYYSATKSSLYGKNGNLHKMFDHERFAENMLKTNHKWLITYDDSQYIRDLFSFAHIKPWTLTYGMRNVNMGNDQKGRELFIANFPLQEIVPQPLDLFSEIGF